ncbi:MAG: DNA polymerase III subunit delta [Oscillospiraceae bacterium]|jgi:DNA polymerase-3 subunit delta'
MNRPELAGNEGLLSRLCAQKRERGLSHAYLLAGPAGSGKHTLALLLAAVFLCAGKGEAPCGACQGCRKTWLHIHPDVKWISAPGVGEARALRKDAYIRPNEGLRKIYIIDGMQTVQSAAQNALLKVLEEGPSYAVFLLLSDDEDAVLETIRSRCETLRLSPVSFEAGFAYLRRRFPEAPAEEIAKEARACGGFLGRAVSRLEAEAEAKDPAAARADAFWACLRKRDDMGLLERAVELEGLSREDWPPFLQALEERLQKELGKAVYRKDAGSRLQTRQILLYLDVIRVLKAQSEANVGLGHCAGLLHVLCAEVMEKGAT